MVEINPYKDDLFRKLIEQRKLNKAETADGKELFVSGLSHNVPTLLRVDLDGHAHELWSARPGFIREVAPSPDGRHLAISQIQQVSGIHLPAGQLDSRIAGF